MRIPASLILLIKLTINFFYTFIKIYTIYFYTLYIIFTIFFFIIILLSFIWGLGRIELPISCTQSKHHTTRPKSLILYYIIIFISFFIRNITNYSLNHKSNNKIINDQQITSVYNEISYIISIFTLLHITNHIKPTSSLKFIKYLNYP